MATDPGSDWAPPEGRHVKIAAGNCFVREAGRGQPPVVFLHGLPDDSRIYGCLQPRLATAHRTFAPDFFGWGYSQPNEGLSLGFAMLDRTLTQVLDALDLERVVLVAHDMSGPAAIRWCAAHPQRAHALVLLNTYYGWNSARMPLALKLLHLPYVGRLVRRFLDIGRTGLSWQAYRLQVGEVWPGRAADSERLLRMFHGVFRHSQTARRAFHTVNNEIVGQIDTNQRSLETLTALRTPTLILWGGQDPYLKPAVARQFHRLVPDSQLHMIADAGHFLQLQAPDEVADLILRFLQRADGD
jgi:haloalkane dehalogenase